MDLKLCPECGETMSSTYLPMQLECFNCGHRAGRGIRTGDLSAPGKYEEKSLTFPGRYRAIIYRVQPLWMAELKSDAVEFEFAAEVPDLRLNDRGFKYRLISIFAAKGFPWPSDFAQESRKDSRAINAPNYTMQLRQAIAGAVAKTLEVTASEIKDLDSVIKAATIPERIKKRRTGVNAHH